MCIDAYQARQTSIEYFTPTKNGATLAFGNNRREIERQEIEVYFGRKFIAAYAAFCGIFERFVRAFSILTRCKFIVSLLQLAAGSFDISNRRYFVRKRSP